MGTSQVIVAKEIAGKRHYQVYCEQHDYKSPVLTIFENAVDLNHAHKRIAHGGIKPNGHRRSDRA